MTTDARDARSLPEEGFHEIQLSGKQLVFLFMATTVVSVVIFLCGVLVGRGARAEAAESMPLPDPTTVSSVDDATPSEAAAMIDVPNAGDPAELPAATRPSPEAAAGGYYDQLMRDERASEPTRTPVEDTATPASRPPPAAVPEPPPAPAVRAVEPRPEPIVRAAEPPPVASAPASSDGDGYVVQVAALRQRLEAEAVADRLVNRGYQAFVAVPQAGSAPFFRVRVGPFAHRAEAEQIVKRLTREEQFKPWITR